MAMGSSASFRSDERRTLISLSLSICRWTADPPVSALLRPNAIFNVIPFLDCYILSVSRVRSRFKRPEFVGR
jgi:hypothetical protein